MSQSVPESKEGSKEGGDGADPGGREEESSQTMDDLGRGWQEARLALSSDLDKTCCAGLEGPAHGGCQEDYCEAQI